jgi:hypothetical protein
MIFYGVINYDTPVFSSKRKSLSYCLDQSFIGH